MNSSCERLATSWLAQALIGLIISVSCSAGLPPPTLHFKPSDHALGDVHPFFKDGECFLYSLKPGNYDSVLARSRDWLRWTETPVTHTPVAKDDWFSPYFVLGVFRDDAAGVYRSFHGHARGRIASSESENLIDWSCAPKEFSVPPGDYYERRRDPFVFWIPERKEYGCVMTTWMKGRSKETGGAISLATSPDLQHWTDHGPIIDPGNIGEPECPQMFRLGAHWHVLASIYDRAVGRPVCWRSGSPLGPWRAAPDGQLDGKDLCAAQIAFDGDTPLLFGWIPLTPAQPGKQHWGGHLAIPREVHALSDGSLGTRFPRKIAKALDSLPWRSVNPFTVSSRPHAIGGEWRNIVAEFEIANSPPGSRMEVEFAPLGKVVIAAQSIRILDGKGQCWSELPARGPLGPSWTAHLVIEDDIIEVFVGEQFSLAARLPGQIKPRRLAFSSSGAPISLSRLRVGDLSKP